METLTGLGDAVPTGEVSASAPARPDAARLVDGQRWGPYRIIRLLGRGGMGEVYDAEQLETGRRVALKVLRAALRGDDDRVRFLREGQLAASISHEHTVYIFGSEEVGGAPAITMELLSGGTLKDRVSLEGPMPPSAAVSAVLDVIGGLDAAQAAGVLHRDVKPSNCFVDSDGTVKVGDFGLSISTLTRDVRHEFATAGFEGTPHFAAPEQLRGEPLDVRADIYAVGATLYYLLTGRPPLDAPDVRALVSKVASETPTAPSALRPDVPRGLSVVVLRCLAKAPGERPQSYAELANLLRPYLASHDVAAPLGARVIAWVVDSLIVAIATWLLLSSAWMVGAALGSAAAPLRLSRWAWLVSVLYYLVLEGGWRASPGKHLMGLRVSSPTEDRWWLRVGLRTAVFHPPTVIPLLLLGATSGATVPRVAYTTSAATSGWNWHVPPDALLSLLSTMLLFSIARRGNGWIGVHELLSRTRVVQRNVARSVAPVTPKAAPADVVPALSSSRRVGPYAVHTTVGETGDGLLSIGFDPILRRRVWIHEAAPGTPPVDASRRDVSRPGRLHWLAGRRSATENWDAFEAPRGEPFLTTPPSPDWPQVCRALSSLATELDASAHERGHAALNLARTWTRADGQLVLLDFSWPTSVATQAHASLDPVGLLAAVSTRAFAVTSATAAPLSAVRLLNRLTRGAPPAFSDIKTELQRLASVPSRASRVRRALPIVMATMPVAVSVLAITVILPSYMPRSEVLMWMGWLTDSGGDARFKTAEQRTAAEQYITAHFGAQLTSDQFWRTEAPQTEPFVGMRQRAAEIAARYPTVSRDQLASATAIVAPQIQEAAEWRARFPAGGEALRRFVVSGFVFIPVLLSIVSSVISALVVPGGLLTRALGHAVVTRDGREIGRTRSAVRLLIAWLPVVAWMAYAGHPMFGALRVMSPDVAYAVGGLALVAVAAGAVWTVAVPSRGPHDRIAGTWVVRR